jgi:tetratricopeptide (TPR) repeat protein
LYFPAIFDYSVGAAVARAPGESALQESIELYRKGRLAEAIASLQNEPERLSNPQLFVYRAGLFLLVGRLDEAKPDIERAIALDPRNSDAYSLQAVIAVVQNDKDEALQLADKAVALDPASPAARISLSYAQQARFQIEQSLATVQKAVDLDPQNALAWARLAELEMSTGNLDRALGAAKRATGLNPDKNRHQHSQASLPEGDRTGFGGSVTATGAGSCKNQGRRPQRGARADRDRNQSPSESVAHQELSG